MELEKLDLHTNSRGALVEAFKFPNDGQVFYVIANPGESRGNHYHKRKTEHFLVINGSAEMSVKDRVSGDMMSVEVTAQKPMTITIIPNHTHRITASSEGAIILVWVDEQFDPLDSDTYPEEF